MTAQTNVFTNGGGDESWMNPANWSLGIIPTTSHHVSIASGQLLRVPSGSAAEAMSMTVGTNNELIVALDATLEITGYIDVVLGGSVINRGNIILLSGNTGIKISTGGMLLNNDSIYIYAPDVGIDFLSGTITNNEFILIDGATDGAISMLTSATFPNQRHLINNAGATISISNADGYGIWIADTLTNFGSIAIHNVDRDHPNVPAEGVYLASTARLFNHGTIDITESEDHGLRNNSGTLKNESDGLILLSNFQDKGFLNESISDNYGSIDIECTTYTAGNRGIELINGMTNRTGGDITITGNDILEVAIEVNNNLTNENGATINIAGYQDVGLLGDGGGFTNHGSVHISDVNDLLAYGMEVFSFVDNYGTITFENMGSGIRNMTSYFNNYGSLVFHNLLSKAIFCERKLVNHPNGTILVYNDDGSRISWGITHASSMVNEDFINQGSILMDSVHVGLDLRIGEFINNGLFFINHYRYGIDFGTFSDPGYLINNDRLILRNHEEPLSYTISLEGGDPNVPNLINGDTALFEITNAYRGLFMASGLLNEGEILLKNIEERAIYLNNTSTSNIFENSESGNITIEDVQYGVYFGTSGSPNLVGFSNEGTIHFKLIGERAVSGENSTADFINSGDIYGTASFDCDFIPLSGDFHPGDSPGAMQFVDYQASTPYFHIELKGYGGAGQPNGHDIILVSSSFTLSAHLVVDTLAGFIPELDDEFTILFANGTLTGSFITTYYADIGPNLTFAVLYEADRVKLKVIPRYTIWTGTIGTSWNNPNNWLNTAVPDENSFVLIGSAPNYPVLANATLTIGSNTGSHKCRRLEIASGGQLTLLNSMFEIHEIFGLYGTFDFYTTGSHQVHLYPGGDFSIFPGAEANLHDF